MVLRKDSSQDLHLPDDPDTLGTSEAGEDSVSQRISSFLKGFSVYNSGSRLNLSKGKGLSALFITPSDKKYRVWVHFILITAVYSSLFTPLEFGFFRGLSHDLWVVDLAVQFIFLADIIVHFFLAFRDTQTYRLVFDHRRIAIRYAKSELVLDLLGCMPWDTIYKSFGRKEEVRYLVWFRLYRVRKVEQFFQRLEKDIRISYFLTRIFKLLAVEYYCTHTAACLFYYLATTVPSSKEQYTWIGSLTLGAYSYHDFRAIDLGKRYAVSMYWAVLTMATVGYGDVHAVSPREMIFVIIFVSFDMILGAYLIGNMTALIVKGSHTERFRDRMTAVIQYMNHTKLPRDVRRQMKSHVRLQFESRITNSEVIEDFPVTIRGKIASTLYGSLLEEVKLFKGCSPDFLNEIVGKITEEHFLPGELVVVQGGSADQLYIVANGFLEEIFIGEDGTEEVVSRLCSGGVFGEVAMLCNIAQPFSVRVSELCSLLRLDKGGFNHLVQLYFNDGRKIITNLLEWKDTDARIGQMAADISFLIAKQEAELALMVNNASYDGDLRQLEHLIKAGASAAKADYDGRTPLHLAAAKGYDAVLIFLLREGAHINCVDKFGMTPLLEAVKAGHDHTISVLVEKGAHLYLDDPGSFLCQTAMKGNVELMNRLILAGVDLSSSDYDKRTAMHIAAAEGSHTMVKILVDGGADVLVHDRWGRTPLDEAITHGNSSVVALIKEALHKRKAEHKHAKNKHRKRPDAPVVVSGTEGDNPSPAADPPSPAADPRGQDGAVETVQAQSPSSVSSSPEISKELYDSSLERYLSPTRERLFGGKIFRKVPTMDPRFMAHEPRVPSILGTRKRITIYPYHPWAEKRIMGKVAWLPSTLDKLLDAAGKLFGKHFDVVLNQDGGELASIDLIVESDKIYVVNEKELRAYQEETM